MEIRKNSEWFEMLTKDDQERFRNNCIMQRDNSFFEKYLLYSFDFDYFISVAFSWKNTDEGFDYWDDLASSNPYARLTDSAKDIDVNTSEL